MPLPRGAVRSAADLGLGTDRGDVVALQARPLDAWGDGSWRWVLLDFRADRAPDQPDYVLSIGPDSASPTSADGLSVTERPGAVHVETGAATFEFAVGGCFPFSSVRVGASRPLDVELSGLRLSDATTSARVEIASVRLHDRGPLRAEIEVQGSVAPHGALAAIDVEATVELFAGLPVARVAVTIRNRRRAEHPAGHWVLGDAGSVLLQSATLALKFVEPIEDVACASEPGADLERFQLPFEIHQASSGGPRWNAPTHRNRDGKVRLPFRGYRLRTADAERTGTRAEPVVAAHGATTWCAVTILQFWENCPRAISVTADGMELGLFPAGTPDPIELQGGEQKTHRLAVAFGGDPVAEVPLAWCHDPQLLAPDAAWLCDTGAVPFLVTARDDPRPHYLALTRKAVDPVDGFLGKREAADEYGWRNFGDLPADHESVFQQAGEPFVSHYNNQYDAMWGFGVHFLRTTDPAWWRLMNDLARHCRDIDIYHTTEDKAAYNGGLFWHTTHYADAGTSTHRTYPHGPASGGPSAEHNYNAGLMLHYFLTGDRASAAAAIGLGRWVREMDDGRLTVFRWLAHGATGLASATGSADYHGPGRGAGHSILACLVAARLSGDRAYLGKAEELIRRAVHPGDDIAARQLTDPERRWSYTAFLQVLGQYLHEKADAGDVDVSFDYARASLVHYARWMAVHEAPYLENPGALEFPTETWAAQDLRKADVFLWAASHVSGDERQTFLERATFFHEYALRTLAGMPTHIFTRPLVLLLVHGVRYGWFLTHPDRWPELSAGTSPGRHADRQVFEPQRRRALRRARIAAVVVGLGVLLMAAGVVVW